MGIAMLWYIMQTAVRWVLDMLSLQIYIETERDQMMVELGWIVLELTAYVLESYCVYAKQT